MLDFSSPPALAQVAHFDTRPEDNVVDFLGAWGVFTDYVSGIVVLSDRQRGLFVFYDGCDYTGGDLYVATSGNDAESGITLPTAKRTIQAAINAATNGDVIVVAPGTYHETINFNGAGITLRSACGPTVTTIDAGGSGSVVTCNNGEGPDTVLDGFTITGGWADDGGGMYNGNLTSPTVTNCAFSENTAGEGGGMYNNNSSTTVANCTFSENTADNGGGMYNNNSSTTVTNCTFSPNEAGIGGGMYNAGGSSPTVTNCILWGDGGGEEIFNTIDANPTVTYSNVEGGYVGVGNIDADPIFVDPLAGNLRLSAGSPCIDAGSDSAVVEPTDLDGNTRVIACSVDMGAYELQTVTDTDGDGVPDGCDSCVGDDATGDSDGDGVCDSDDLCPGGDDNIDDNGNGVPDACDFKPPVFAQAPHDILKNRYISIDPRGADQFNVGADLDIRLTLTSTLVSGVTVVGSQWWASAPDADCIAIVGPTQPAVPPNWDACPTLHLTGCPIIPTSSYDIVVVNGSTVSDPPLVAATQAKPGVKWHGDCVGNFTGPTGDPPNVWTAPNATTNADDFLAAIKTFQDPNAVNATHVSVTDMEPHLNGTQINLLVNINDVFSIIRGFQGFQYNEGQGGPDLTQCP